MEKVSRLKRFLSTKLTAGPRLVHISSQRHQYKQNTRIPRKRNSRFRLNSIGDYSMELHSNSVIHKKGLVAIGQIAELTNS